MAMQTPLRTIAISAGLATAALQPDVGAAQEITSRAVVQPLPSKQTQRLNRALVRLAKRPRSMAALLEAGEAATDVGDLDAALGFYARAKEIEPTNPKVSLGLASVYLQSGRPVAALPYFALARDGGAKRAEYQLEEALALDMVGEQAAAQSAYVRILEAKPKANEARRRLAISYAISGNSTAFESTLRPLVERRDFASFRARAFGLAIMGEQARAEAIVEAVMPRDLAAKINPYLEFMPRLTPAQQAASANLGIFPKPADIGRDSPQIAAYRDGLTSPGEASADEAATQVAAAAGPTVENADTRLEPAGRPLGPEIVAAVPETSVRFKPETEPEMKPLAEEPVRVAAAPSAPVSNRPPPASQPKVEQEPQGVADAFADLFDTAPAVKENAGVRQGAVDIAAIDVKREVAPEPEPQPKEPEHPERIWVQVATGKDLKALGFDWRRLSRRAPDLLGDLTPHTVRWGEANRLLAGPLKNRTAARDLVNALSQKGIDTFSYTSPKGTRIQELK